ncbi:unnamed protein product [Cyprideis torosa]|uniref:Uncharacterized protein n=1 Tax=Cyprideis torosa TaxID=163714 RepID=A0A7R8WUS1_9CRUS|nr:unnamed protein product [Cyprideis torosa]CAG0909746.1 unnamed protein product [Cyprideis torosa]
MILNEELGTGYHAWGNDAYQNPWRKVKHGSQLFQRTVESQKLKDVEHDPLKFTEVIADCVLSDTVR